MYRLPPQPLLPPAGYRIPVRGRAPDGPPAPLAARLGYPAGRGRGRGRGKGKGRQRNRNRSKGANKKGPETQPVSTPEEEKTPEVTENTTAEEETDDITDDNWQVISEETEETDSPKPKTDNYVDFHSDMFDTNSAEGFSTFSEPVLVISDETETPAAAPIEEVTTEEVAGEQSAAEETNAKDVVIEISGDDAQEDTQVNDESQEVTILEDEKPASIEESTTKEQSTPAKETKISEKPSPNITAITAPKPSSPKEMKKNSYGQLHCEVIICHVM